MVDAAGVLVHDASLELAFAVSGAGELAAVGSGDPADVGSFYIPTRTTYLGKAAALTLTRCLTLSLTVKHEDFF